MDEKGTRIDRMSGVRVSPAGAPYDRAIEFYPTQLFCDLDGKTIGTLGSVGHDGIATICLHDQIPPSCCSGPCWLADRLGVRDRDVVQLVTHCHLADSRPHAGVLPAGGEECPNSMTLLSASQKVTA